MSSSMLSLGLMMICREWILRLCSIAFLPFLAWLGLGGIGCTWRGISALWKNDVSALLVTESVADTEVAKNYEALLGKLGVTISKDKSLISSIGVLEFAKRYMVRQVQKDLSPISLRALLTVRSTLGMCQLADLYKITNPNVLFRLAGAGFRV